jgi:tRNA(Ile)-lysidine synthase
MIPAALPAGPAVLPVLPIMDLLDRVRRFIRDHDLIRPDNRVVAAVSGGSDSVALACILRTLHTQGDLRLAGLAHFNHQLRPTADRDEQHAAAIAMQLGVPVLTDRADVAARARAERRSVEAAGRIARYDFFDRARHHFQADLVALGHTRDDQAETVLLRLIRGAGPRGLAAMHPRRGFVVRPLLTCRRSELRAFLAAIPIAFMHDESNDDVSIIRNRVRAELIPLLETRFNPSITDVLADEAELARELWQWLHQIAAEWMVTHVRAAGDTWRIELASFAALPAALRRAVLWRVMNDAGGSQRIGFAHVSAALAVAAPHGPATIDVPALRVERIGAEVVLTGRGGQPRDSTNQANLFRYPLPIPGEVLLPGNGWTLSVETVSSTESVRASIDPGAIAGNGRFAAVRADKIAGALAVRNRRPGDRFRPAGLTGRKKLQDFFVDLKIARNERDRVPLVVDENDRIVWVAGHRIDETFRVTDAAQHVLLLRLRQI